MTFLGIFSKYKVVCNSSNPSETSKKFGIECFNTDKSKISIFAHIIRSKYIIVGGGSQLKTLPKIFGRNPNSLLINILIITVISRILFKKVYFISIGAGPLESKLSKLLTRLIIIFTNGILLRDSISYELISSISKSKKIAKSSDGLYYMKKQIDESLLGLSVSEKQNNKSVLICPNLHTHEPKLATVEIETLSKVCDYLNENGYKISFIPFQIGFTKTDDLFASKEIIKNMSNKLNYNPIIIINNDTDIFKIIEKQTFVIGVRLHSIIIGSLCNTPSIAISYDPKVSGYMKDTGLERYCLELNGDLTAKSVIDSASHLLNNYEKVNIELKDSINRINNCLIEETKKRVGIKDLNI
jgi:polysaccharide pyruvyl transferase WcaK-like protein